MAQQKLFHAVADDTALVANISEIKKWVAQGTLTLVIPTYTLERLHLLKRDTSQIGINAREALKFLDRITSGKDNLSESSVQLQGPDDMFPTWQEVETFIQGYHPAELDGEKPVASKEMGNGLSEPEQHSEKVAGNQRSSNALSQILLDKLNFAKEPETASNASTPPTSPSSSNLHSTKASPEVTTARPIQGDDLVEVTEKVEPVTVPHTLRPLINTVVFLLQKELDESSTLKEALMLTNDHETTLIARSLGLNVKNIYQLRSGISSERQEIKNHSRYQQKHSPKPSLEKTDTKTKTLFSYEDEGDDDDEIVFNPRPGRDAGLPRGRSGASKVNSEKRRSVGPGSVEGTETAANIPIPTEEIDPDSFDRGAFARSRATTPVIPSTTNGHQTRQTGRSTVRGNHGTYGMTRGSGRGYRRGVDRSSARGNGKLFVP